MHFTFHFQVMMYGRGIYMSENPIFCKQYGNCIILCKVIRCELPNILPNLETLTCECMRIVNKDWCKIYVIPTTRQILPFCIIELKSDDEKREIHIDQHLQRKLIQDEHQAYRNLVLHALICLYKKSELSSPQRDGVGDLECPKCIEMKPLLLHLEKCILRSKCTFKDCYSTWTLIEHWKHCLVNICLICKPYRRHKEKKRMIQLETEKEKKRVEELNLWRKRIKF